MSDMPVSDGVYMLSANWCLTTRNVEVVYCLGGQCSICHCARMLRRHLLLIGIDWLCIFFLPYLVKV